MLCVLSRSLEAGCRQNIGGFPLREQKKFHARNAFIAVSAFCNSVFSDFDRAMTEIAHAMMANAEKTIVLADHSKFSKQGTFVIAPLEDIDYLVTNRKPDTMPESFNNISSLKLLFDS